VMVCNFKIKVTNKNDENKDNTFTTKKDS
jgi:hypothetical protein